MLETFVTAIHIFESRNIKDLHIPLFSGTRQHLMITGKNGSGKTSLLHELESIFNAMLNGYDVGETLQEKYSKNEIEALYIEDKTLYSYHEADINNYFENYNIRHQVVRGKLLEYENYKNQRDQFSLGEVSVTFSNKQNATKHFKEGNLIFMSFAAKRESNKDVPISISKEALAGQQSMNSSQSLLQFLVNMWANKAFLNEDGNVEEAQAINDWFEKFKISLRDIFDASSVELHFKRKELNFDIIVDNKEKFNFNNLSDGFSAVITILSELIVRMERRGMRGYDMEGIVLIDEVETHLHVDLQKKVLPFLINFFPRIQFIVTTHSPFVLSSISNATVCDLEKKIVTSDLSGYSYDAILESYFGTDKYSEELKSKLSEYETLVCATNLSYEQQYKLILLKEYFDNVPKFLSRELYGKIQQIELDALTKLK